MKTLSTSALLSSFIFFFCFSGAQTIQRCGTDENAAAIRQQFPESEIKSQESENNYQNFVAHPSSFKTSNGTKYIIPVVVHVIHRAVDVNVNDSSNISNEDIYEQIEILNNSFRGQVSVHSSETDAQIEFRLAQKDPDGNCTNGIIRIANDASINISRPDTNPSTSIKRFSHWNPAKYLNIYVVHSISGGILGYSTFPWETGTPRLDSLDGVVIGYQYFGFNQHPNYGDGKTTVHEVGHWLGLYHTFQPTCTNATCTTGFTCKNDTCISNGDRVCDTPPVSAPNFTSSPCTATPNSCVSDADDTTYLNPFRPVAQGGLGDQPDQIQNYMDYVDDVCMERFTVGQLNRMNFYIVNNRASVWADANLLATGSKGLLHDFDSLRTGFALDGKVKCMVEWPGQHKLILAGDFTHADGLPVNGVASWNGTAWDSLPHVPSGMTGQIYAMEIFKNNLYTGGTFDIAGQFKYMAVCSGSLWFPVDTNIQATSNPVNALKTYKGKLYVGGDFGQVAGNTLNANRVASWDGIKWDTLGSGLFGNSSACYAFTRWNNYLVAGGRFVKAGGIDCDKVALWNGASWVSLNTGTNVTSGGRLNCLGAFGNKLYSGGDYSSVGGALNSGLSNYDGQFWGSNASSAVGINRFAIEPYNGLLWVGGDIFDLGTYVSHIFTYDDALDSMRAVSQYYDGFDAKVNCMTQYKDELYIGGDFTTLRGVNGTNNKTLQYICKVKLYCEQSPVGIKEEHENVSALSVYPNPASGKLIVENTAPEIFVFNLMGQSVLMQKTISIKTELDVSAFASGIYFVRSGNEVRKFIKE